MNIIRKYWAPSVGIVAIVAGWLLAQSAPPASFGWFAYAPLSDSTFTPPFVTGQFWIGIGTVAAGLALLAGWVGFRLGTRGSE